MEKIPPIAKIYEAYSCIADNRIEMKENMAIVHSSDSKKTYEVKWQENNYSSTDNASFWQGYPGYPVIAVLLLQRKLPYYEECIAYFQNINWHALNDKYKRDYDAAVDEVLSTINFDTNKIKEETQKTYEILKKMEINIKRKI